MTGLIRRTVLVALATTAFAASQASATVIDFQDVSSGSCAGHGTSLQSRGFNFTGNPADPALFVCNAGVIQSNTSAALINANDRSILTMTQVGGGTFSLQSFFAGGRARDFNPALPAAGIYDVATSIDILGHLLGGGTVMTSVALDAIAPYDWAQYSLSSAFSNLVSVVFTAQGSGPRPEFLIDDIVVNAAQVPAPLPAALLTLGLVALGSRRRAA